MNYLDKIRAKALEQKRIKLPKPEMSETKPCKDKKPKIFNCQ